jgi:hypothetical protein
MRGVAYRSALAIAETRLGERGLTVAEVLRQNGDKAFESFMGRSFSATDWYDIYPAVHFAPLVARASGISMVQYMRASAAVHAEQALRGFTAVLLKLVSNETVASWIPRISAWYHDFGPVETRVVREGHVRGTRRRVPVFAVQAWSVLGMHFVEHVLRHAGATEPRVHALEAEPDGSQDDCPLYQISFDVTWSE